MTTYRADRRTGTSAKQRKSGRAVLAEVAPLELFKRAPATSFLGEMYRDLSMRGVRWIACWPQSYSIHCSLHSGNARESGIANVENPAHQHIIEAHQRIISRLQNQLKAVAILYDLPPAPR